MALLGRTAHPSRQRRGAREPEETGQPLLGDRFGLRRLVEIDTTKGIARVAKRGPFLAQIDRSNTCILAPPPRQTYYPQTDTGPDDDNGIYTAGATGIGLYV